MGFEFLICQKHLKTKHFKNLKKNSKLNFFAISGKYCQSLDLNQECADSGFLDSYPAPFSKVLTPDLRKIIDFVFC